MHEQHRMHKYNNSPTEAAIIVPQAFETAEMAIIPPITSIAANIKV